MPYKFDTSIDRRSTNSIKWNRYPEDVLPMLVKHADDLSEDPYDPVRTSHPRSPMDDYWGDIMRDSKRAPHAAATRHLKKIAPKKEAEAIIGRLRELDQHIRKHYQDMLRFWGLEDKYEDETTKDRRKTFQYRQLF